MARPAKRGYARELFAIRDLTVVRGRGCPSGFLVEDWATLCVEPGWRTGERSWWARAMGSAGPAVVLLSGGLDSTTVAAIALDEGHRLVALTVDYGQRHRFELEAARRVAKALGIEDHREVRIDLTAVGGSALTDASIEVPQNALGTGGIPVTYVPARNTVFLAVALGLAETVEAGILYFGANALDYSGYPDCRPEFVAAFEALARVATRAGVEGRPIEVRAPLMHLSKAAIIRRGTRLGVDYRLTHSCYDPDAGGRACGRCDACLLRRRGFEEAGLADPTPYRIGG